MFFTSYDDILYQMCIKNNLCCKKKHLRMLHEDIVLKLITPIKCSTNAYIHNIFAKSNNEQ